MMADAADDILIAYPAIDPARTRGSPNWPSMPRCAWPSIRSPAPRLPGEAANRVSATIGILVDLDVGFGRTGLQTASEALKLAQLVEQDHGAAARWTVLLSRATSAVRRIARTRRWPGLRQARRDASLLGRPRPASHIVSGGSTPTRVSVAPGPRIHRDSSGHVHLQRHEHGPRRLLLARRLRRADGVHGRQHGGAGPGRDRRGQQDADQRSLFAGARQRLRLRRRVSRRHDHRLSEEHGQVDIRKCATRPKLGERVTVIPNHICPCVNLQDSIWWRDEEGKLAEIAIDARGRLI